MYYLIIFKFICYAVIFKFVTKENIPYILQHILSFLLVYIVFINLSYVKCARAYMCIYMCMCVYIIKL